MAIGKVNVSSGNSNSEILIEFDNYISSNLTSNSKMVLEVPIGSKYKFEEHNEEQIADKTSVLVNSPATGYVKYINGVIVTKEQVPASILFAATEGENTLHLKEQENGFDCVVDWGDGSTTVAPVDGGPIIHSYETAGDYNIKISGKSFAGFCVDGSDGSEKYKALYSMGKWEVDTLTDMSYAFSECTSLTALPIDLFKYNTLVTDMNLVFYSCTGLTALPVDLFKYNTLVTSMCECFSGCTSLTEIPIDLFKYNTLVTDMSGAFSECTSLTEIPIDLFKYNTEVINMNSVFMGCTSLTTLPVDLFRYNTGLTSMGSAFSECTSLTEIPADLFRYNTEVTYMNSVFYSCTGLTEIPIDLFKYNTSLEGVGGCFMNCSNLTTLPANLFKYNTKIADMNSTFEGCDKLTLRSDIFGEDYTTRFNGKSVEFWNTFNRSSFTGTQGAAPTLWNFTGLTSTKTGCFGGAGNNEASLSNYADIPEDWK